MEAKVLRPVRLELPVEDKLYEPKKSQLPEQCCH